MFFGQRPNQDRKHPILRTEMYKDVLTIQYRTKKYRQSGAEKRSTNNIIQTKEVLTIWCREKKYKQCNTDQRNTDNLMQRKEVQTI